MGIEYKGNQGSRGKRLDPKRKDALDLIGNPNISNSRKRIRLIEDGYKEDKLTSIYHEFAETISENETDEQIVARSKEWFVKRLSEETDNKEAIESIANQLVGCLKQASVLSNLEKKK